jgi:plasmid stability protein
MITVRDLDPVVKEKLRAQAARHGRSMEAEVRQILTVAVDAVDAVDEPVDLVASIRKHFSGVATFEQPERDRSAQRPVSFEL